MGLNTVLVAMVRYWWVIVLATVVTAGSTAFFVLRKDPVYRATATVQLRPSPALEQTNQILNAADVLDKRATLNTLARTATGNTMQGIVAERLHIPADAVNSANLTAAVIPDTNLIEIRAQSINPQLAAAIPNQVANIMLEQNPEKVLRMDIIDAATPPTTPIEPQPSRMIALGALSGAILGMLFALANTWLRLVLATGGFSMPQLAASPAVLGVAHMPADYSVMPLAGVRRTTDSSGELGELEPIISDGVHLNGSTK